MKGTEEGGKSRARQFQTHKKKREYKQVPVEFYIRIDYLRYLKKGKKKRGITPTAYTVQYCRGK